MSSIIRNGQTFHGIQVFGRGVFTNDCSNDHDGAGDDKVRWTYAGQHKDGYACGLGVLTSSLGWKIYADHGPDGFCDGRCLLRYADGETEYDVFEHDEPKGFARVFAKVHCTYNGEACAPDDPRLLALIAQVAPVEVRPATPTPHPESFPHSPPSNRPVRRPMRRLVLPRRRSRPPRPPRCTPTPHVVPGGRAMQANNSCNAARDHAVTRAWTDSAYGSHRRLPRAP